MGFTDRLPFAASDPVQLTDAPEVPVAKQPLASIDDQVSVVEPPKAMDGAASISVGTTIAASARMNP